MRMPFFDIASLHRAYGRGTGPDAVIEAVFERMAQADDPGIFLHLESAERLKAEAAALGSFDPAVRPLWGVPVAVKDNVDCAGMPTTAACPAFAYTPETDAAPAR